MPSDVIAPIRALFPAKRVNEGYSIGDLLVITNPEFVEGIRESWREYVMDQWHSKPFRIALPKQHA